MNSTAGQSILAHQQKYMHISCIVCKSVNKCKFSNFIEQKQQKEMLGSPCPCYRIHEEV